MLGLCWTTSSAAAQASAAPRTTELFGPCWATRPLSLGNEVNLHMFSCRNMYKKQQQRRDLASVTRCPKDHINARILQTMISGVPLISGLGAGMSEPYIHMAFWAPSYSSPADPSSIPHPQLTCGRMDRTREECR